MKKILHTASLQLYTQLESVSWWMSGIVKSSVLQSCVKTLHCVCYNSSWQLWQGWIYSVRQKAVCDWLCSVAGCRNHSSILPPLSPQSLTLIYCSNSAVFSPLQFKRFLSALKNTDLWVLFEFSEHKSKIVYADISVLTEQKLNGFLCDKL